MKHKKFFCTVLLAIAALFALLLPACAAKVDGPTISFSFKEERIWLDRYEERMIELETGDASALSWSSSDESVVTVTDGLAVAQGVGTATITAAVGGQTDTLSVTVNDSGERPRIAVGNPSAYLDMQTDFSVAIEYLMQQIPLEDYELTLSDQSVASFADGKITGLQIGTTEVTITAEYKGLELENTFTLTCRAPYEISVENTEIEIYNTTNAALNSAQIGATLLYCGEEDASAELTYTVETGADYVTVADGIVTAKGAGEATVRVSYAGAEDVSATVSITVHENYIEETFINGAGLDVDYGPYTDGEAIGGRTEGVYVYQHHEDPSQMYECRVFVSRRDDTLRSMYEEGIRYFAYDMYYPSGESMPDLYLGLEYKTYFPVGNRFASDWLLILDENGKQTNMPVSDQWFTVVYDLYALLFDTPTAGAAFYLVQQDNSAIYVSNVRYWLDDTFITERADEVTYTEEDGYIAASSNEFVLFGNTDEDDYAEVADPAGQRGSVMKFTNGISTWRGALANRTSLGDSPTYGIEHLRELGNYFTFDIYLEDRIDVYFAVNNSLSNIWITPGMTDISNVSWLYLINEEGQRLDSLVTGEWITVGVRYSEAYDSDNGASMWRSTFLVSTRNPGEHFYVDNLRYYADDTHIPETFAESNLPKGTAVSNAGESVELVMEGEMAGTILYKNASGQDASQKFGTGIKFTDVIASIADGTGGAPGSYFDDPDNKFMSFEMYIGDNTTGIGYYAQASSGSTVYFSSSNATPATSPVTVGELFPDTMNVYNMDGSLLDTLEAKTWYKVYLPMEDGNADPQWVSLILLVFGGSAEAPAEVYLRNIAAAHENPYATEKVTEVVARKSNIQVRYVEDFEGASAIRYVDGSGDAWSGGIGFAALEDRSFWGTDNIYVQFDFKIKSGSTYRFGSWVTFPGSSNMVSYGIDEAAIGSAFTGNGCYVYQNFRARKYEVKSDKWTTVLMVVPTDNGAVPEWVNSFFYVGGTAEEPSEVYIRNVKYTKGGEDYMEFMQVSGTLSKVEDEGVFLNSMKLVNSDQGGWDNGVKFLSFENRMFFKMDANAVQFEVYFEEATSFWTLQYLNDGSVNNQTQITLGQEIPADSRVSVKDADGNDVNVINTGAWYTITIRLRDDVTLTSWSFVNFTPVNAGGTATTYMRNVEYVRVGA